jgi:hypothetical protein
MNWLAMGQSVMKHLAEADTDRFRQAPSIASISRMIARIGRTFSYADVFAVPIFIAVHGSARSSEIHTSQA